MQSPNGDDNGEIDKFENLLKKNTGKNPSALYSDNIQNISNIQPKDVLDSVYSQIRTIQLADIRSSKVKENPVQKCNFLSVNRLPVYNEVPKPNDFETQCFSNTQLINIIDDAEALHQGMTQEFESTFLQPPTDNKNNTVTPNQLNIDTQEFETTFTQTNVDATIPFLNDVIEREEKNKYKSINKELDDVVLDIHETKYIKLNAILNTKVIKPVDTLKALCGRAFKSKSLELTSKVNPEESTNKVNEGKNKNQLTAQSENEKINKDVGYIIQTNKSISACENRSLSPVFEIKIKKVKAATKNLVVSLEDFEKFEKIALPLIDIDKDLKTCKHLINSQILEGELCLNADGDLLDDIDQFSPILQQSCEIIINNEEEKEKGVKISIANSFDIKHSSDKRSDSLKDEILFSSDEENDFIYKEYQELPLTAVLETSFYDHFDDLDNTMIVGFQTANNKSIQISTGSFYKAQNMLDEDCNDFSMKDLVEICNEKSLSKINTYTEQKGIKLTKKSSDSHAKESSPHKNEKIIENTKGKEPIIKEYYDTVKKPTEKTNFVGFVTASNKQIKIPDKALELGKKVFIDIDFEDKNDLITQVNLKPRNKHLNKDIKDARHVENDVDDKIDDILIREFENIEMSLEEIENKDYTTADFNDKPASNRNIDTCGEDKYNLENIDIGSLVEKFKFDDIKEIDTTTENKFIGVKTANNKNIQVSVETMAKTKVIFDDINTTVNYVDNDNLNYDENHKLDFNKLSTSFVGFKTANNRAIKISDAALLKSHNIFKDIDTDNTESIKKEVKTKLNSKELQSESMNNDVIEKVLRWRKTIEHKNTDNFKDNANRSNSESPKNHIIMLSKKSSARMKKLFENLTMEHSNDNEPHNTDFKDQNNTFKGFQTASKKSVDISVTALQKSKKIFHEIDCYNKANPFEEETYKNLVFKEDFDKKLTKETEKHDSTSKFEGFKTASNKNVDITKEAIARSKRILDFNDLTVNNKTIEKPCFQTANNKKVLGTKEDLQKTKSIFNDIPDNHDDILNGFRIANNQKIEITKETIEKTQALFNDIKISEIKEQEFEKKVAIEKPKTLFSDFDLPENNDVGTFRGFQTASNKKVQISKEAIEKTKALFNDIDIPEVDEQIFRGDQNAINKEIKISTEAIKKTKKLFNDIDVRENNDNDMDTFKGFQTASNKKVIIPKEAIEKTKALFNDIDIPEIEEQSYRGFQTASNKMVEISTEAIEKTKTLFSDIDIRENNDFAPFKGFQTASNKKVKISKEAIEKTKALFNDIEIPDIEEQCFSGFQAACNKNVKISGEALNKIKTVCDDLKNPEHKVVGKFLGFQTGNKNNVTVSEEALATSRQFLQDKINLKDKSNKNLGHVQKESCFKTANNKNTNVPKDALINSKKLVDNVKFVENIQANNITKISKEIDGKSYNLDNLINTQVLGNFEKSLYTEDFNETPKRNKRSGSPILSCPRAKKRKKFEAPYKEKGNKPIEIIKAIDKPTTVSTKVIFSEGYKKNKAYTVKDLPNMTDSKKIIEPYIKQFNLENILNFVFEKDRNDLTDSKVTVTELKEIFLSAVNKNLVPEGWLDNHIKLILWKLLSYEVKFNFKCTLQTVIDQLKYRYDKELYNAERSAFRKILEKDDVAVKTMVLCVAGVFLDGVSVTSATTDNIELLLTDGWYFIKATIDKMLSKLVADGRIVVGSKIVTCGAELANCDQGVAPWEDTSAARLKLSGNSTRPAPWHSKLGYSRTAILSHLSSVKVDGGRISKLKVFVTRVYPLLYVERFEDGSTVTRSERLEHLHQNKFEADRELMMERIYEEVQREFSDQESQDSEMQESGKRRCYDSGSQIAKMMKRSRDPMEFRAQLTSSQVHLLQDHTSRTRQRIVDTIQERIQDRLSARNVVTLARGRIAECEGGRVSKGMLSIWKPNEAVLDLFREGACIEIMNVVPTAMRYSEIQITAGRQTMFHPTKTNNVPPVLQSLKRKCYRISDVADNPSMSTEYNEIDTAGIVFLIEPPHEELKSNNNFQNVYLTDVDKNIISINFWGGVKKFGFENILDTGQIVACSNLQKRAGNTRKNIPQFRVTEFSSFTKTPRNIQARDVVDQLSKKMYGLDRRKFCDDCIAIKKNYTAIRCLNNSENESPYRFNKSEYSFTRNKMFIDTPLGVKPKRNEDVNLNLTGLDFESSFKRDTQELSPNTLQRKKKVNDKIAKLKMYGEPPPLSPINIINKSMEAKSAFKNPLISNNVATPNPQISDAVVNNLPEDSPKAIPRSPIISMKRTYVKSVPVKLNFEENKSEVVDHFAEDFDTSPPLSLD